MRNKTKPRHISHLLGSDSSLGELVKRASQNEQLLISVRSRLPDPLCNHCIGAALSDNRLTLFVDSPSWITRLRFLKEELKQLLAPLNISFTRLEVKVYHSPRPHKTALFHPAPLSTDNAALIRECAETISEPQLRNALLRLSDAADND